VPIPPLLTAGLLPDGIHECTVDEIVERFGAFQETDRRPRLAKGLRSYIEEVRSAGVGKYLVVDGSFVTAEPRPGDIDLLLVLRDDIDLAKPVPPFQYNARSKRYVRKNYGFDFFVGFENDQSSEQMLALFRDVKNRPGSVKGYLKVVL
jgi:hypothetical protein